MKRTLGIRNEFELYDESFAFLVLGNTWVERLYSGTLWAEGPVYFADGDYLLWSDVPGNRMLCWTRGDVTAFREPSRNSNGNTRDRSGRLITCEHATRRLSRTEPNGCITEVVATFNGKRFNIRVFDVLNGKTLGNGRVFTEISPGVPDGIRIDVQGNVWTSAADGVHCYSPTGRLLGKIKIPEPVANLTFGGPKRNRLFITATSSLYAVYVATQGVQQP